MTHLTDTARTAARAISRWWAAVEPALSRYAATLCWPLCALALWLFFGGPLTHTLLVQYASSDVTAQRDLLTFTGTVLLLGALVRGVLRARRYTRSTVTMAARPMGTAVLREHAARPATLDAARRALEREYGMHNWFFIQTVLAMSEPDDPTDVILERAERERIALNDGVLPELRRARHEAAHAVVAHHAGLVVISTDIAVAGGAGGTTSWAKPAAMTTPDASMAALQTALAGPRYDQRAHSHDHGGLSDHTKALTHIAGIQSTGLNPTGFTGPLTTDALTGHALEVVNTVLDTYDDVVTDLADLLLERRHLDHHDMRPHLARIRNTHRTPAPA